MHPVAVEQDFRLAADRLRRWGIGLLAVAAVFWAAAAWRLFLPYEASGTHCAAPALSDRSDVYEDRPVAGAIVDDHERALRCAPDRDWPGTLAAVLLSLPFAVAGSALYTAGAVSVRLRLHAADVRRARS